MNVDYFIAEFTSGDEQRAEAAARAFPQNRETCLPLFRALLAHNSCEVRWWAVRALAESTDPVVLELLPSALHDPDPAVRQCAALALRQRPNRAAIPGLLNWLSDQDSLLARLAGDALAAAGEASVPALLEIMHSGSPAQRIQAVRALAQIGDQRAIPVLFEALDDPSAWIEYWANEGLERMGVGMTFFKP